MTIKSDDWRLQGQKQYLQDARLVKRKYQIYREGWDHDHCIFCKAKFCLDKEECLSEGYATEDNYYWICESCFNDFREMFGFKLKE